MMYCWPRRLRADCLDLIFLRRLRADCLGSWLDFLRRLRADCLELDIFTAASCRLSWTWFFYGGFVPTVLDLIFYGGFVPTVLNLCFTAASCRLSCCDGGFVPTVLLLTAASCRLSCCWRRLRADCLVVDGGFVPTVLLLTAASCRLSGCDGGFVPTVLLLTAAWCRLSGCDGGFVPTVWLWRRLRADCLLDAAPFDHQSLPWDRLKVLGRVCVVTEAGFACLRFFS